MLAINTADSIAFATADASFSFLFIVSTVLLNFSWHYLLLHVCNMSFCVILSLNETILRLCVFFFARRYYASWQSFCASSHFHDAFVFYPVRAQMNILSEFTCRISQYLCTICEMKKKTQIPFRMQLANEMTRRS